MSKHKKMEKNEMLSKARNLETRRETTSGGHLLKIPPLCALEDLGLSSIRGSGN